MDVSLFQKPYLVAKQIKFNLYQIVNLFYQARQSSPVPHRHTLFFTTFRFVPGYYKGAVKGYFVYCTYKLKWKPLFDGLGLGVMNI